MRRINRRQLARSILVALQDQIENGVPVRWYPQKTTFATFEGWCRACGGPIDINDYITKAVFRTTRLEVWVHVQCPPPWYLIGLTVEKNDPSIITDYNPEGRKTASCGHNVEGKPIYLVRDPMPIGSPNHSRWICEDCKRRGYLIEAILPHDGEDSGRSRDRISPGPDGGTR
jgi:hypothetical protein